MAILCSLVLANLSETAWLVITGFLVIVALAAFCFIYAFITVPVSRKLESNEQAEQARDERLDAQEEMLNKVTTALKRQGILTSDFDRKSPRPPLHISGGPA